MHNEGQVPPSEARYVAVQTSHEFQELRRLYRGFVLPVTGVSLVWYFAYVGLAAYAHDFMSHQVVGNINVGLIMGLLQFVTTFGVTALYVHYAGKVLDPLSSQIREDLEGGVLS